MLKLSLWVALTDVSSLSLQCPKIVYLPQAIKSLLFTNQKRTNKFHCSTITRGPKTCRKGTKRGTNFWQMGIQRGPFLTYVKGDLKFEFFKFVHKQWIVSNFWIIGFYRIIESYRIVSNHRIISNYQIISNYRIISNYQIISNYRILSDKSIFTRFFTLLSILSNDKKNPIESFRKKASRHWC